jgi:2-(1,2-epoxy-1,2-dihydrophenyl)acetyl-CoA isomerase
MKVKMNSYESQDFYLLKRYDDVAMLKLGKNFLSNLIDLSIQNPLLHVFDDIEENNEIKALVIMNCLEKMGPEEYIDFFRQIIANEPERNSIHRLCNIFDQLILKIVGLNKLVIHTDCGEVIPLFLNMSLACDYRIVATHTIFEKPYFELGMLPKGGGAFFLCKMLGNSKTRQLLESEKEINAIEALEFGIVDQVVPYNELEKAAFKLALRLSNRSTRSLAGIKRLINYTMRDLKDYLSFENQEIIKMIGAF